MQKGQKVILLVLCYCVVSWFGRDANWSPRPLVAPVRVAELFEPPGVGRVEGRIVLAPRFTRPVEELIAVPEATAAEAQQPAAEKPHTWDGFIGKLRELDRGVRPKVRVIHLGDSELVADGTAGQLRRSLAARFGLGGLGFSLPVLPLPWYMRDGWTIREGVGVKAFSYPHGRLVGGMYGPGGVAFDAVPGNHGFAKVAHPIGGPCALEMFFARMPKGGRLRVRGDGKTLLDVSTASDQSGIGVERVRVERCPSKLEVVTAKRLVRFYGWSIEYDMPGIVWTNLGVVSAQLPQLDHYDPVHLQEALAVLRPDLVVMTFGLNLAASPALPPPGYRYQVQRILRRVREGMPNAACLVTGPYPVGHPREGSAVNPESRNAEIISTKQRQAAEAMGCVFLDRFALAGGAGAARRWVGSRPKLLSGDYHHLTVEGGNRMGRAIANVMLAAVDGTEVDHRAGFQLERQVREGEGQ